jgi:hypothetical protein
MTLGTQRDLLVDYLAATGPYLRPAWDLLLVGNFFRCPYEIEVTVSCSHFLVNVSSDENSETNLYSALQFMLSLWPVKKKPTWNRITLRDLYNKRLHLYQNIWMPEFARHIEF